MLTPYNFEFVRYSKLSLKTSFLNGTFAAFFGKDAVTSKFLLTLQAVSYMPQLYGRYTEVRRIM